MTQRELPTKVPPATTTEPPIVSMSTGSWTTGIDTLIPGVTLAAMKELAGKTVSDEAADIIEINGRAHELMRDNLDNNKV